MILVDVDLKHVNTIPTDGNVDLDFLIMMIFGSMTLTMQKNEILVKKDAIRRKTLWLDYKNENLNEIPIFDLGIGFSNCEEFKDAIRTYSILKGYVLKWLKNYPTC